MLIKITAIWILHLLYLNVWQYKRKCYTFHEIHMGKKVADIQCDFKVVLCHNCLIELWHENIRVFTTKFLNYS